MNAAIVLAAGQACRMAHPKLALRLATGTLLQAALKPLLDSSIDEIVVVLGHAAEVVRAAAGETRDRRLRFVTNERWAEGMASSLRKGVAACPVADAVLVVLADKIGVTAELVERVLKVPEDAALVVPRLLSRASHPVRFSRALLPELLAIEGDVGARDVVRRHLGQAVFVPGEALYDVDDAGDYERLRQGLPPRRDEGLVLELPEGV
jgi:molybdenum cofactor cytidylyltransferase